MKKEKKDFIRSLQELGYLYITRAAHGELNVHKEEPKREINYWESRGRKSVESMMFNDLTWHDNPIYIGKR